MRYKAISPNLFIRNRREFTGRMRGNTLAILTSNDVKHTNVDDVMGFAQNSDLFYLTGINQEETILLLYPDAFYKTFRQILFIKNTDEQMRIWDGEKLSKEEATQISGIDRVEWVQDFEKILQLVAFDADGFYLGHNEHIKRATREQETRQDRMIAWCKEKYPLHDLYRASKITRELRTIKSPEEVSLIQKAIWISAKGYHRVIKALKPGMMEYELEAELIYELTRNGATRHAFKPIVASGKNACALHYNTNDNLCKDGDMLLLDFGVCYANYNSDTTRCLPVNGKFSERQKQVYNAVLLCLKEGSKLLKPGTEKGIYVKNMARLVEEQLIGLGLLDADEVARQDPQNPLYLKYFMHGTAHHIGLDVHDVGASRQPIQAGMVFTCEPGIYIPEEGIGCRLENDYLITANGNVNLSHSLPIEIEEIEALMADEVLSTELS